MCHPWDTTQLRADLAGGSTELGMLRSPEQGQEGERSLPVGQKGPARILLTSRRLLLPTRGRRLSTGCAGHGAGAAWHSRKVPSKHCCVQHSSPDAPPSKDSELTMKSESWEPHFTFVNVSAALQGCLLPFPCSEACSQPVRSEAGRARLPGG